MTREFLRKAAPGLPVLFALIAGIAVAGWLIFNSIIGQSLGSALVGGAVILVVLFMFAGLFTVEPNEAKVLAATSVRLRRGRR